MPTSKLIPALGLTLFLVAQPATAQLSGALGNLLDSGQAPKVEAKKIAPKAKLPKQAAPAMPK